MAPGLERRGRRARPGRPDQSPGGLRPQRQGRPRLRPQGMQGISGGRGAPIRGACARSRSREEWREGGEGRGGEERAGGAGGWPAMEAAAAAAGERER